MSQTEMELSDASPSLWVSLWPRLAFLLFLVSNALLSFSTLSPLAKSWIVVGGILLPFAVLIGVHRQAPPWSLAQNTVGKIEWLVLLGLVALTRLVFLESFFPWPGGDEGLHGFLALGLIPEWKWDFFYTCGEHPPLLIWLLAFLIRATQDTFFSIRILPAIFSILAWAVLSRAGLRLLPAVPARVFAYLLAFSFWPIYHGRFCHQGALLPFFLGAALALAAWSRAAVNARKRIGGSLAAGLAAGLGTLTFTAHLVVLPPAAAFAAWDLWLSRKQQQGWVWGAAFLLGMTLGFLPFVLAVLREGYGQHLYALSPLGTWSGSADQWLTSLSYATAVLWGVLSGGGSYGPLHGGLLNPLMGAGFLAGCAFLLGRARTSYGAWFLLFLVASFLPGLLSRDYVEMYRIITAMPLVTAVSAIGFWWVASFGTGRWTPRALLALVALSVALDLWTLRGPLRDKQSLEQPNAVCYDALRNARSSRGPGWVFTDFAPLRHNHTLSMAVFPFNAAVNPRLADVSASWVGLAAEEGYLPFLKRRFPEGDWLLIPRDPGYALGVIGVTDDNRALFEKWVTAHRFFHEQNMKVENVFASRRRYADAVSHLESGASLLDGDPYLVSVYGEWAAQYFFDREQKGNIEHLRRSIRHGYPAPHLVRKLILLLREAGRNEEADRLRQIYLHAGG